MSSAYKSPYKRKRGDFALSKKGLSIYRGAGPPPKKKAIAFVPGRDRVGGYYGRYQKGGELKFLDVDADDAIIAAGGVITDTVNVIAQGTGESQRIGRKVTLRSIYWRGKVTLPTLELEGSPGESERFRFIMYLDKQCNGAAATGTDILAAVDPDSYRALDNSGRFSILMDRMWTMNYLTCSHFAVNSFSFSSVTRNFSFFKRCDIPIEYNGVNGTIGEIRSNNIGLLIISEGGTGALISKLRLRYSDN